MLGKRTLKSANNDYLGVHRATLHAAAHVSPAYLLHGRVPRTRPQAVGFSIARFNRSPSREMLELRQPVQKYQAKMKTYADSRRAIREPNIKVGDYVRVPHQRGKGKKKHFGTPALRESPKLLDPLLFVWMTTIHGMRPS